MKNENLIIHGDAIKALKSIEEKSIHLIITSPPYNLNIEYSEYTDDMEHDKYLEWMRNVWEECERVLMDGGRLCINMGENKRKNISFPTFSAFIQQCIELGMLYRGTIIWNKNNAANHTAWGSWNSPSNPHIVPRHEYLMIFSKNDYRLSGNKDKTNLSKDGKEFIEFTRSVWSFGTESKKKIGHPAPFPVELPYRLIKFYAYKGNTILDPFAGSGTTAIAAIKNNCNFIMIDNSQEYIDLMRERINNEIRGSLFVENVDITVKEILE